MMTDSSSQAGEDALTEEAAPPRSKIFMSDFRPSKEFLEYYEHASLNYRECALQNLMTLTARHRHYPRDEVLATALYYGATEQEIDDVVLEATEFLDNDTGEVQDEVAESLKALQGKLYHASDSTYVDREVAVGDHKTTVRDSNPNSKSTPVVLIHALALDCRMWDAVFARLLAETDSGVRVLAYDLRGHGFAANAPHATSLPQLATDLHNILGQLDISIADIYGQSYGGAVAQYFALAYPEQTRSLGLITTAGKSQPSWITRTTRAEEAQSVAPLLAETLIRWFTPEAIARNEWGVRYARSCVERMALGNWADAWRCMSQLDTLPRLREGQIKCPVLLVCGVQDASTGPKWMDRLREALETNGTADQVVYKELDPGVHMMALEQGEALTREILEFRKKVNRLELHKLGL